MLSTLVVLQALDSNLDFSVVDYSSRNAWSRYQKNSLFLSRKDILNSNVPSFSIQSVVRVEMKSHKDHLFQSFMRKSNVYWTNMKEANSHKRSHINLFNLLNCKIRTKCYHHFTICKSKPNRNQILSKLLFLFQSINPFKGTQTKTHTHTPQRISLSRWIVTPTTKNKRTYM